MGMFGWLLGNDDEEELSNEQLFMNHYDKYGTILTDDKGNPTLNFSDSLKLYPGNNNSMNRQNLNYLYEMGNFGSKYRK